MTLDIGRSFENPEFSLEYIKLLFSLGVIVALKKSIYFIFLSLLFFNQIFSHMQPIKKNGRYYYNKNDIGYQHIDLKKALKFLDPSRIAKAITNLFSKKNPKPKLIIEDLLQNPKQTVPKKQSIEPAITWIGHSTFLIQLNGFNILTDPIFGDVKAGPITVTKRVVKPGITLENLPKIDAILISHNHSDHTDTQALQFLAKKYNPIVFVPMDNKKLLKSMGFSRVIERSWWGNYSLLKNDGTSIKFTCVPAYHWSIRFSLESYRKSLWSGWMVESSDSTIFFAGDTAYGPHFKDIKNVFPSIDIALMPIGSNNKGSDSHKYCHLDSIESVQAFRELGANHFIPMHYGTFFISSREKLKTILDELKTAWNENSENLKDKQLLITRCGQEYTF